MSGWFKKKVFQQKTPAEMNQTPQIPQKYKRTVNKSVARLHPAGPSNRVHFHCLYYEFLNFVGFRFVKSPWRLKKWLIFIMSSLLAKWKPAWRTCGGGGAVTLMQMCRGMHISDLFGFTCQANSFQLMFSELIQSRNKEAEGALLP